MKLNSEINIKQQLQVVGLQEPAGVEGVVGGGGGVPGWMTVRVVEA